MGLLAEARTLQHHSGPIKINPTGQLVYQPTVISYTVFLSTVYSSTLQSRNVHQILFFNRKVPQCRGMKYLDSYVNGMLLTSKLMKDSTQ